jgi:Flp pilus assembly protein TadG
MRPPLIHRLGRSTQDREREHGVTMALVALAILGIVAMAGLSIDVGTLYQAKAEAQRAADAAALTAARVISLSGITGDPTKGSTDGSWSAICGAGGTATAAATTVAQQSLIGGAVASTITVNYGVGSAGASSTSCVGLGTGFAVNPVVTVYVQQATLPTFFARVFSLIPGGTSSNSGVSATASAEVFNPSDSSAVASETIPVRPRCVKPWIIPNIDPENGNATFVATADGSITNGGVLQLGGGVIGESFNLNADCVPGAANCSPAGNMINNPPQVNSANPAQPFLEYVPAPVSGTPVAIPSCSGAGYQQSIAGCDQGTVYACGTSGGSQIDFTENPVNPSGVGGDTSTAVQCLINNSSGAGLGAGQDILVTTATPAFPFQIQAGSQNPLAKVHVINSTDVISSSNSIVTVPIYDSSSPTPLVAGQSVTIVGFLQVFINYVDGTTGNLNVTVLNVAGCSNDATANPVFGTSPVPVRLITPPTS